MSLENDAGVFTGIKPVDTGLQDFVAINKQSCQVAVQFNTYNQSETINDLHLDIWHLNFAANASSSFVTQSYVYGEIISTVDNQHGAHSSSAVASGNTGRMFTVNTGSANTNGDIYVADIPHTIISQKRILLYPNPSYHLFQKSLHSSFFSPFM